MPFIRAFDSSENSPAPKSNLIFFFLSAKWANLPDF